MMMFLMAWLITHLVFTIPTFRSSFRSAITAFTVRTTYDSWDCKHRTYALPLTWGKVVVALLYAALFGPFVTSTKKLHRTASSLNSKQDAAQKFVRVVGGESKEDKIKRLESEATEREAKIATMERDLLES